MTWTPALGSCDGGDNQEASLVAQGQGSIHSLQTKGRVTSRLGQHESPSRCSERNLKRRNCWLLEFSV